MHAGLRTETSALRDVVGAMVGRMDQLVDCQNALQRQVPMLIAASCRHSAGSAAGRCSAGSVCPACSSATAVQPMYCSTWLRIPAV